MPVGIMTRESLPGHYAGRHNDQGVTPGKRTIDDGALRSTELGEAKCFCENLLSIKFRILYQMSPS